MTDLYAFSHLIKNHPFYKKHRDGVHQIYLRLAKAKALNVANIMQMVETLIPEMMFTLEDSHAMLDRLTEQFIQRKLEGIQFTVYGDEIYPSSCYLMADPPLILSFRGSPAWLLERSLSVVGSRDPSFESLRWMEKELSDFCEVEKALIVSGGARGVDQKAHGIALRKSCPTVVILPSGLKDMYPNTLAQWIDPVLEAGGCFLSEYDHEQTMHKHLFHHRNRLIAAMGAATLLVEARRRSGTLITANQAVQLGRPVWVVPGHPQDPHFAGCLDLLSEGATMVRDAQDLSMFFHSELISEKVAAVGVGGLDGLPH
ncbi:DNA-processing protein DprA [Bdellovibrio sp. NC01]|uniref:DNA-processing protein DprA n=1 Tax=Bdellovibrio sp. NC01 TaxID=2220073 RepID=UPI00115714F7|nr:DNA-processing protein DprA [Bdellovibrio sp. NC01]QDK38308.1 DNA-processing protein DprA [Bdellovibrio sp. NC01]